nr:choice-of-anchor L domain-containing protein [Bacteroidota bacterium]
MNKTLLLLFFLASAVGYSQITIDETLTTQQLVEDILIDSPCAQVSLFTQSTGTDFSDVNGIAAFDANGSGFPFAAGVVLSSGNVASAPGPNTSLLSEGGAGWPGDADLEAATTATNTNNASFIQFNFVPLISNISFDFIMASEEYNDNFECTFSDAFAFILTDNVTGVTQNLAVLPGTTTPIEVTNIRYEVIGQCPAVNEIYFGQYNFQPVANPAAPTVPAAGAPINFNGQTVELTAMGNVVPGNDYTIKLVVADESDTAYDISVYLEAGSFNIGVDLGPDA